MTLEETKDLMLSSDYKERFIAEYWQVKIRYNRLKKLTDDMITAKIAHKTYNDVMGFTPKCNLKVLRSQLYAMEKYVRYLRIRANIENISLGDDE